VNYTDAVKRPFADFLKLVIGALLSIIPVANFMVIGYVLSAGELSLTGKKELPEWEDWGDLLTRGFLAWLISVIWVLPVIILGMIMLAVGSGGETAGAIVIIISILISMFILSYIIPLSLLSFIEKDCFSAAFDFKTIFGKAFTSEYFVAWLLVSLIRTALLILAFIVPFAILAYMYVSGIFAYTAYGEIYHDL
jgi:hypothetical protein